MAKPADYRHIWTWGRMMQSNPAFIHDEQARAADADAPIDAIYFSIEGGDWVRFTEVTEPSTLMYFERHHK